jgi:hypothetical protein
MMGGMFSRGMIDRIGVNECRPVPIPTGWSKHSFR